jgi:hypothetical protein
MSVDQAFPLHPCTPSPMHPYRHHIHFPGSTSTTTFPTLLPDCSSSSAAGSWSKVCVLPTSGASSCTCREQDMRTCLHVDGHAWWWGPAWQCNVHCACKTDAGVCSCSRSCWPSTKGCAAASHLESFQLVIKCVEKVSARVEPNEVEAHHTLVIPGQLQHVQLRASRLCIGPTVSR